MVRGRSPDHAGEVLRIHAPDFERFITFRGFDSSADPHILDTCNFKWSGRVGPGSAPLWRVAGASEA